MIPASSKIVPKIIKTTASAMSWDEWANANNIKVVNVPVGFKEIANIIVLTRPFEKQIKENRIMRALMTYNHEAKIGINSYNSSGVLTEKDTSSVFLRNAQQIYKESILNRLTYEEEYEIINEYWNTNHLLPHINEVYHKTNLNKNIVN